MNASRNKDLPQPPDPESTPRVGSRWNHSKGGHYVVLDVAIHTETHEYMVVYRLFDTSVGGNHVWVRPMDMFMDGRFTEVKG